MIEVNQNTEHASLAATLKKSGIAATEMDAKRMAEEMIQGSKKVVKQHEVYRESKSTTPHQAHEHLHREIAQLKQELQLRDQKIDILNKQIEEMERQESQDIVQSAPVDVPQLHAEPVIEQPAVQVEEPHTAPEPQVIDPQPEEPMSAPEPEHQEPQMLDEQRPFEIKPIADEQQEHSPEIVNDLEEAEQPSLKEDFAEEMLDKPQIKEDIQEVKQDVSLDLQTVEEHGAKDNAEYEEEQAELGFIGQDINDPKSHIDTKEDAPVKPKESTLSAEEKESTDLSKLFNVNK